AHTSHPTRSLHDALPISDDHRNWFRIRITLDQYEGWISAIQHHSVSREYFDYSNHAEFKITTELTTSILYNKRKQFILMGSIIPDRKSTRLNSSHVKISY